MAMTIEARDGSLPHAGRAAMAGRWLRVAQCRPCSACRCSLHLVRGRRLAERAAGHRAALRPPGWGGGPDSARPGDGPAGAAGAASDRARPVELDLRLAARLAAQPAVPRLGHAAATLLGFVAGHALGVVLAVASCIVQRSTAACCRGSSRRRPCRSWRSRRSIIVVLGHRAHRLLPKAIISMYLCFFPVAIGMVKGLTLARSDAARSDAHLSCEPRRRRSGSCAGRPSVPFLFAVAARSRSRSAWSAPSSASCRPARRPGSARGCSPAPITARRCRSGRRWSLPPHAVGPASAARSALAERRRAARHGSASA